MRHRSPSSMKVATGLALAALALAATAGAASAPPIPGARYQGHSTHRGRLDFHVARNGRHITTYVVTGGLVCNQRPFRGGRYHWRIGPGKKRREPQIRIHSDGTFAITVHTHQPLRAPHSRVVRIMRGAYTLKGSFAALRPARDGSRRGSAKGTLRAVLTAPGGLRCSSGTRRWSARGHG